MPPRKSKKTENVTPVEESVSPPTKKKKQVRIAVDSIVAATPMVVTEPVTEEENIVVRLQVQPEVGEVLDPGEEVPVAYNRDQYTNVPLISEIGGSNEPRPTDSNALRVLDVLKDFEQKNKNNEWPANTSIACYWCCHSFCNAPVGIPVSFHKDHFEVFGCFCSLECAAAYNFKSHESVDEMWERHNLIQLLSRKMGNSNVIRPAPDRLSLKMFGGFMTIEDFRGYTNCNKLIHLNFPPMTSLTQQIEEVNEYELNADMKFIPLDHDRINRCKEKLAFGGLKRTKKTRKNIRVKHECEDGRVGLRKPYCL